MTGRPKPGPAFLDENARWVRPLIVACLFAVAPNLARSLAPPAWVNSALHVLALIGMAWALIAAALTKTFGAKVFLWTAGVLFFIAALYLIFPGK